MEHTEYERIARTYIDMVYRIAVSYTKTSADADDIVQQTFMKLLINDKSFTNEEHIKRWLIRVCINNCNSLFSSYWRKNVDFIEDMSLEPKFSMPEKSELYYAIKNLPHKCRIVVYLFYYEEYSSKEIADILHINEATVRTRLSRSRKILRTELKEAPINE